MFDIVCALKVVINQKRHPANASHTGGSGLKAKRQSGDGRHDTTLAVISRLRIDLDCVCFRWLTNSAAVGIVYAHPVGRAMHSRDLTPKQASDLHQEVHRITMYFNKLANRMAELQFAPDDKLFRLMQDAERSLAALSKETYAVRTQLHPRVSKRSSGM